MPKESNSHANDESPRSVLNHSISQVQLGARPCDCTGAVTGGLG